MNELLRALGASLLALLLNQIFWCAFLGTMGKELAAIHKAYRTRAAFPKHKTQIGHYVLVVLLGLFAGWLAVVVLETDNPTIATIIGFTVLIIMENFSEGKIT